MSVSLPADTHNASRTNPEQGNETMTTATAAATHCSPRSYEHEKGIEWASLALVFMAEDNGTTRTSKRPDIDETLARQACRIGADMEDFVQGDSGRVAMLTLMRSAVDFHEWLERCFEGDLSHEYFRG